MSSLWSPLYIQHTIAAMAQTVLKELTADWKLKLATLSTAVFGNTERINATDARVEGMREEMDEQRAESYTAGDTIAELGTIANAHDRRVRALENDLYRCQCQNLALQVRADAAENGLKSALEGLSVHRETTNTLLAQIAELRGVVEGLLQGCDAMSRLFESKLQLAQSELAELRANRSAR